MENRRQRKAAAPARCRENLNEIRIIPMISFQTNIDSLVAQQNLNTNSMFQSNTIQQLTSGYRINSPADDAAGLAVANQDRDQHRPNHAGRGQRQQRHGAAADHGRRHEQHFADPGPAADPGDAVGFVQLHGCQRQSLNAEFQTDIGELNRQAQAIGLNTGGTLRDRVWTSIWAAEAAPVRRPLRTATAR
jgi:flagellin